MTEQESQAFLNHLDKKLWATANKLRGSLDAAVYKHAVLGLVFLKYVSVSFEARQEAVQAMLQDPDHDYYLDEEDFGGLDTDAYKEALHQELEDRDYYREENVFWVPALARWKTITENATAQNGDTIEVINGKKTEYKFVSLGRLIDDALEAVERENDKLKGYLEKNRYARLEISPERLRDLVILIGEIPFEHAELHAKDILGHVYEYFLGQFALAEGKKGGQYFTPKSIVSLIVEMIEPFQGRVYDPACGSGGFFVQSEKFIKKRKGNIKDIHVYGQESNPTTWRLAAMNMVIRAIEFDFGKQYADTFISNQHPDLRADYIMANPPFNIKDWWHESLEGDRRWQYGTPPKGNANFAWLQHMISHLSAGGSMALLLANGSMSSNTNNEGTIRQNIIEADLVECMVALPGQLFTNTQIPACIWFLTKDKSKRGHYRDRAGEVLFIDARKMGYMKDRVLRDFTEDDIDQITGHFHAWKTGTGYEDIPGVCASKTIEDIKKHDFVLTPGRYVGAEQQAEDTEPFLDKMARLTQTLRGQFEKSAKLQAKIEENLALVEQAAKLAEGGKDV